MKSLLDHLEWLTADTPEYFFDGKAALFMKQYSGGQVQLQLTPLSEGGVSKETNLFISVVGHGNAPKMDLDFSAAQILALSQESSYGGRQLIFELSSSRITLRCGPKFYWDSAIGPDVIYGAEEMYVYVSHLGG
jgi:hypothetical protein